jgi:hypothetical protein
MNEASKSIQAISASTEESSTTIYILPNAFSKSYLADLKNATKKNKFILTECLE